MSATQTGTMPRKRQIAVLAFLLAFSALCYAAIIPTYFVSDDFVLIGKVAEQGMYSRHGENGATAQFLRPGTTLSYLLDYHVWGLNPIGYHLTNILFHGLTGCIVFLLAQHLFRLTGATRTCVPAVLAAALFLALPCHSESVSWISGRTDVIAVAFGLAGVLCFVSLIQRGSPLLGSLALFLLWAALLTKECAVMFPVIYLIFFALDWSLRKARPSKQALVVLALSFLSLPVYILIRRAMIGQFIGGYGESHLVFLKTPLADCKHVAGFLLRTFLPPFPPKVLSFVRSWRPDLCVSVATSAAVSLAVVYRRTLVKARWGLPGALVACYFFGLVLAVRQTIILSETFSERFLYLPSVFACILLVYGVASLISSPRRQTAILAALIVMEAVSLQWVNTRWITASQLCRQIAVEVSKADPAHTAILNVPDNFRGAYVFRNGLSEAATVFLGRPRAFYRVLSQQNLRALQNLSEAQVEAARVRLIFSPSLGFNVGDERGFDIEKRDDSLSLKYSNGHPSQVTSLLSFRSGASRPMLRVVDLRTPPGAEGAHRLF